ncbi:MAG: AraC family transcriptional regulator [Lachnospiraceae bacterium]|jgi:AraC-like DNA-binding protein|nr:AraC family transcriptional regulator [Lachnospiraceae bacterium]
MTQQVRIERLRRDPQFQMQEAHLHSRYELYYLNRGSCSFFVGGRLFAMQEGSGILIPPGVLHSTSYRSSHAGAERTALFFREEDLNYADLRDLVGGWAKTERPSLFLLDQSFREGLEALFAAMLAEDRIRDCYCERMLDLRCKEVLLYLSRCALYEEDLPQELRTGDPLVLLAARFIGAHYAQKLGIPELARACGCSESLLSLRFKRATGIGVHAYLQGFRLQQAASLLAQTKRSVTDIAFSCGFQSPGYFKDAFRKVYGISPRAYRRQKETEQGQ